LTVTSYDEDDVSCSLLIRQIAVNTFSFSCVSWFLADHTNGHA